ncbi:MAG: DMT family transporter [Hormoscilla sp. GM7CHS1pb]|nr:DMT family transporter [Hormoscilla sp. GM7CHS1pb]
MKPPVWKITLVLAIAVLAISTSAIFSRLAFEAAGTRALGFSLVLAASRLTLAALILLPTWGKVRLSQQSARAIGLAVAAGLFLAVHFPAWITSLGYTSIAASTTLVTTNPIWVSLLSWIWFREKITSTSATGIAIAIAGGILIGFGDAGSGDLGSNPILGNFLALIGAWAVSFYLLLGREAQRQGISLGGYMAVAYSTAALVLLPMPFLFGGTYAGHSPPVYFYILLMAILPQLVGHSGLNWAVLWMSPTLVTLSILFEPLGASFGGYLIFGEVPTIQVFAGAVLLLAGVAVVAIGHGTERQGHKKEL